MQGDYASDATFASAVVSLRAVGYDAADILDRDGAALDITALLTAAASSGPDGDAFRLVAYQQDDIASPAQVSQTVSSAVSSQNENGSWNSWGFESADTTAMMLAALAPYTAEAGVSDAMADAVAYLESAQGENGGVMSWGSENANSTAMAIIGLKAAGIDPVTDVRFVTDGGSNLLDGLLAFATAEDDGFGYADQVFNDFATKQAFLALIAAQSADVTDNVLDFSGHAVAQGAATQNPPDPGDDDDDNGGDDSDDAITVDFVLMDVPHAFSDSIDVPEGTSVRTVFTRAMNAHSVPYTISGGYVVEIDGLAEFDGGANAGWMYLVNGTHPGIGIGSCVVHDGDEVTFHYSGDYTEEDDSWGNGDSSTAPSSSGGGAQREAHERVRETGLGQLAPAIESLLAKKPGAKLSVSFAQSPWGVFCAIPARVFTAMENADGCTLSIDTGAGTLRFDAATVRSLVALANGGDLTVAFECLRGAPEAGALGAVVFRLRILQDEKEIAYPQGGVTLSFPLPGAQGVPRVWHVSDALAAAPVLGVSFDSSSGTLSFPAAQNGYYVIK